MWDDIYTTVVKSTVFFLPQLLMSIVIFVSFWAAGAGLFRLIQRLPQLKRVAPELTLFLAHTAKIVLVVFGAITALGTLGVQVTALVTGLGLVGFATAFGLKDIISNALSGGLVIIFRPFKQGDHLSLFSNMPIDGKVTEINLRYTVLDSEDKTIFVPNSILFTNVLTVHKPKAE